MERTVDKSLGSSELLAGFERICGQAGRLKCVHDDCAQRHDKKHRRHITVLIIMNVLTAFLLAGNLKEMYPPEVNLLAGVLAAIAALCTGFLMSFDYKGRASRHSELSTCYAALQLGCQADMDRFKAGRFSSEQFDTILGCNVGILKELKIRSHGLDSACRLTDEESS